MNENFIPWNQIWFCSTNIDFYFFYLLLSDDCLLTSMKPQGHVRYVKNSKYVQYQNFISFFLPLKKLKAIRNWFQEKTKQLFKNQSYFLPLPETFTFLINFLRNDSLTLSHLKMSYPYPRLILVWPSYYFFLRNLYV